MAGIANSVGARLRALRTQKGYSARQLAIRAGVSTEMVTRAEKAERTPSLETLAKLCDGLDSSLGEFFTPIGGVPEVERLRPLLELLAQLPAARRGRVARLLTGLVAEIEKPDP